MRCKLKTQGESTSCPLKRLRWKRLIIGTSLAVQWLRICPVNAGNVGSVPVWGTKFLHAMEQLSPSASTTWDCAGKLQWKILHDILLYAASKIPSSLCLLPPTRLKIASVREDRGQLEPLYIAAGAKWYSHFGTVWQILTMLNIHLVYNSEISPWYLLKRNICPQKDLFMNVHSSIIQNNQIMETTQMLSVGENILTN